MRRPLCILCLCYVVVVMIMMQVIPAADEKEGLPEDGSLHTCVGQVYRMEMQTENSMIYLKNNSEKIICYFTDTSFISQLKIGNRIMVTGICYRFQPAGNEGQFDAKQYYRILGIDYSMTACEGSVVSEQYDPYRQCLYRIRCRLSQSLETGLSAEYADVMQAMLLGEKRGMDEEIKELYQRNGIAHILAISGLHITFLGMGLFRITKKLRFPLWIRAVLSFVLIVSFGEMTGAGASTVRSVIMFSLYLLAENCGRTYDTLTALMVSAVGLLVYQPRYIFHSGFLLSFGSIAGIALIAPMLGKIFFAELPACAMTLSQTRRQKLLKYLKGKVFSSLCTSLSVVLATLPIQMYFYYTIPLYSVILNLWIVPLMGVLLPAGIAGSLLGCLWPSCSTAFCLPCRWILMIYEGSCRIFERLPLSQWIAGKPTIWQIVIYYAILFAAVGCRYVKEKQAKGRDKLCCFGVLVLAVLILGFRYRSATTCTMLDVGQGDCLVIEEKNGKNILVDGGSSDVSKVGKYRIVPYLKSHGISRIDYAFLSHSDTDHVSGILEMLENQNSLGISVRCLVLTKFAGEDEAYHEILQTAENAGIRVMLISAGDYLVLGEIKLQCLYPARADRAEGNDQSMILQMECGQSKMLFTGDLTTEKEMLIDWEDIDLLKVAHHGSKYSTSDAFLDKTTPQIAIISCGRKNRYGHPHQAALERLETANAYVFRTDQYGAVTVRFVQDCMKVTTFLPKTIDLE